jgi:hypothetical protein
MRKVAGLLLICLALALAGCGGGVLASEVNATCAYHGGIETVKNGPNNEAFVKCKDGYGKEIESHE